MLSPLMCTKLMCCILLFEWCKCGVVDSAAALINNDSKFECSVAGLQDKTV